MSDNKKHKPHITIVGAGASGTTLAIYLLRELSFPAHISLIEKNGAALHRGVAYSSSLPYEPLNVPTGKMSIYPEQPDNFFNYVKDNKNPVATREQFVSRRWFGDYLTNEFQKAVEAKHPEVSLKIVEETVADITKGAQKNFSVSCTSGNSFESDFVVLATGNEAPQIFSVSDDYLSDKCFHNPWEFSVEDIDADDTILIIGTGLTMIDIVGSLYELQHKGKIIAISRNGKLPCLHTASRNAELLPLGENESLDSIFHLVRDDVKRQSSKGVHWSRIIDALRPHTVDLWKKFTKQERKKFLRRFRNFWETHRHRMPPASGEIVEALLSNNKLEIHAGNISKIEWNESLQKFEITLIDKQKQRQNFNADVIINCTGPATDLQAAAQPLFKNLLWKKWIKTDELGLGIETGVHGELSPDIKHLYAIGPLRKASEWESTAMREIVQQARALSAELIASHPDLDALISALKKLDANCISTTQIQSLLTQIAPEKLNYQSLIPTLTTTDYTEIKLLSSPVECSLIVWSGASSTPVHAIPKTEVLNFVLEGSLQESTYSFLHGVVRELQNNIYAEGAIATAKTNSPYKLMNAHRTKRAVSLRLTVKPSGNFDDVVLFDLERKKIGTLSKEANQLSWDCPAVTFKSLSSNAFIYEPLLEFMI